MAKESVNPAVESAYLTIEKLREKLNTPPAQYAGAMAMMGWSPGKKVTETEFTQAIDQFRQAKTGGGK